MEILSTMEYWCRVDTVSGSMWDLVPEHINVTLVPGKSEILNSLDARLTKIRKLFTDNTIDEKAYVSTKNGLLKNWLEKEDVEPETKLKELRVVFNKGLLNKQEYDDANKVLADKLSK